MAKPELSHDPLDHEDCKGFYIPRYAEEYMDGYQEFEVREDDIFIACYPKCGTTWLQQVVYLIIHGFGNEDSAGKAIDQRIPYIELSLNQGLDSIKAMEGLRILKTHMPYCLLPPPVQEGKGKVITIARNPKDMAVSLYHFMRKLVRCEFQGDFRAFMKLFMADKVQYAPYNKHIGEYWQHRNDENMLFLFYEDMQKDLPFAVMKIATFLNLELSSEMLKKIVECCSFKYMQKDPSVNYSWLKECGRATNETNFMRKGEVGDWKNYLTEEDSSQIEEKYKYLESQGLKFTYEL